MEPEPTSSSTPARSSLLALSTVYALRAAVELAREPEAWVRADQLSVRANLPPAYVSKVLRRLVNAGIVAGKKGWNGGFRLARPPEEVQFRDLLDAMEDPHQRPECAFGHPHCEPSRPCALHDAWSDLRARLRDWACRNTLAGYLASGDALGLQPVAHQGKG